MNKILAPEGSLIHAITAHMAATEFDPAAWGLDTTREEVHNFFWEMLERQGVVHNWNAKTDARVLRIATRIHEAAIA